MDSRGERVEGRERRACVNACGCRRPAAARGQLCAQDPLRRQAPLRAGPRHAQAQGDCLLPVSLQFVLGALHLSGHPSGATTRSWDLEAGCIRCLAARRRESQPKEGAAARRPVRAPDVARPPPASCHLRDVNPAGPAWVHDLAATRDYAVGVEPPILFNMPCLVAGGAQFSRAPPGPQTHQPPLASTPSAPRLAADPSRGPLATMFGAERRSTSLHLGADAWREIRRVNERPPIMRASRRPSFVVHDLSPARVQACASVASCLLVCKQASASTSSWTGCPSKRRACTWPSSTARG